QRFKAMHTDLTQRGLLTQPSLNLATESTDAQEGNEGKVIAMPVSRPTFWKNRTYMTVAASLILLVGVSWLFLWKQSMPTAEAIQLDRAFNSVFTPDPKSAPVPPTDPDLLGASQPA